MVMLSNYLLTTYAYTLRLILSPAWLKRLLCALQWKFITRMWIKSICGVLSPKSDEHHWQEHSKTESSEGQRGQLWNAEFWTWHGCLHSQKQLWSPSQLLNKCKPPKILPDVVEELRRCHLWVKNVQLLGDGESFLFGGCNQQKGTCAPVNGPTPVHIWAELTVGIV